MVKKDAREYARAVWKTKLQDPLFVTEITGQIRHFLKMEGRNGRILASYPLPDEVDFTGLLLETKRPIYMPLIGPGGKMEFRRQDTSRGLLPPHHGHLSVPGAHHDSELLDLPLVESDTVFIPCLASGPHGERLGRGGGYYDRWKDSMERCARVGIVPDALMDLNFHSEGHDLLFSEIITETRIQVYKNNVPKIY